MASSVFLAGAGGRPVGRSVGLRCLLSDFGSCCLVILCVPYIVVILRAPGFLFRYRLFLSSLPDHTYSFCMLLPEGAGGGEGRGGGQIKPSPNSTSIRGKYAQAGHGRRTRQATVLRLHKVPTSYLTVPFYCFGPSTYLWRELGYKCFFLLLVGFQ